MVTAQQSQLTYYSLSTTSRTTIHRQQQQQQPDGEARKKEEEEEEEEIRLKEMLRLSITIVVSYTKSSSSHLYRLCRFPPFFIL